MATRPTTKVSLKLFIEKGSQRRVLFAEADKEFVDFLFSIFTLPVGTVTRLLKEGSGMVGSWPSLYKSIENMSVNHIQPAKDKSFLLQPKVFMPGAKLPLLLPNVASTFRQLYYKCSRSSPNVSSSPVSVLSSSTPAFGCSSTPAFGCSSNPAFGCSSRAFGCSSNPAFGCSSSPAFGCSSSSCSSNLTDDDNTHCTCGCKNNVLATLTVKGPPGAIETFSTSEEGYVRETVTYMVMDDLEVKPLSTNSLVTLLSQFNVNDIRDVEEKVVDVGMDEGVKLFQASLHSKTVLTDIFLPAEITRTDDSVNREGDVH